MAVLLLLSYAAICVVVFRIFHVPANKWTVTTAAIGAVVLVGGLLLGMNYNHPFTTVARLYYYTTPIIPEVKGRVVEVVVRPNVTVQAGDVLFTLDPQPYQYVVDQKKAALAEAEQNVKQLKAVVDQAAAGVEKAKADVALAQLTFERQQELLEKRVAAQTAVDRARRDLDANKQALVAAEAAAERAQLALTSQIGGVNTTVARLTADLRDAEYNLDQATVRAPTAGYVTQLFLRPGMMVTASPTMIFVHHADQIFSAAFPQSVVQRLHVGGQVEIAFHAIPGHVFAGRVTALIDAVSQGQLQASGTLLEPEDRAQSPGLVSVNIDIVDDISAYQLPSGSTAQVAVYSDHWRALAIIRKMLLRMKSWTNYLV